MNEAEKFLEGPSWDDPQATPLEDFLAAKRLIEEDSKLPCAPKWLLVPDFVREWTDEMLLEGAQHLARVHGTVIEFVYFADGTRRDVPWQQSETEDGQEAT